MIEQASAPPTRRGIRKGVYIIPSLFTTGNIFCGFYSVTEAFRGGIACIYKCCNGVAKLHLIITLYKIKVNTRYC